MPVIIYSQDSLFFGRDTITKHYFESIAFRGGVSVGPYMQDIRVDNPDNYSRQLLFFPLSLHLEKRLEENKLITLGLSRNAVDNSGNNWRVFPKPNLDFSKEFIFSKGLSLNTFVK